MAAVARQPAPIPRPHPRVSDRIQVVLKTFRLWRRRARSRRELSRVDARGRADIGVRYEEAAAESRKPFWRG